MRVRKWLGVATLFLLVNGLQGSAFARPRGIVRAGIGFRTVRVVPFYRPFFGFYGGDPYWYWDPWYAGPNVVEVERVNYGTVEFKVKPEDTKVYVDQKYLGTVNELEGRHHTAKLPGGYHNLRLVAPDGRTLDRTIYLALGQKIKVDEKL